MNNDKSLLSDLKLQFNINHPNLEECYGEGFDSAIEEIAEESNPYPANSLEREYWQEGWWAGFYQEEPLLNLATLDDTTVDAANEGIYHYAQDFLVKFLRISSAIAVTALVGYQFLDLVA